ncbi:MAG: NTP transferase domain-containing protein [Deltaproteobacteria bacterium]|nr:NTP transferase domain-containing protein [Deltaproteobacteria bacterium]NIS76596.1 NTP transferase domain-containing protein [Deltaproteobacteria bacterium]
MKAVVMAGGFGTRLRPLTENVPKPMVPVANLPMMEHVISLLKKSGITDLIVLLFFQPEKITGYFQDGSSFGVGIEYVTPEADYGTAGAVKQAAHLLDDDENFVVISADIITDIDISSAVAFHREKKSLATIVLTRVENPLEYGIVIINENGGVVKFLEKPSWGEVFSDTINTGIYILNRKVLDHIPVREEFDFSKQLFPNILSSSLPLFGHVSGGYWKDVGNLDEYMNVHKDIFTKQVVIDFPGKEIKKGVFVGKGTRIDFTANIENSVIGRNVRIGQNVSVIDSVLGDACRVEDDSVVNSSVVWDDVALGRGVKITSATIGNEAVIGSGATISDRAVISRGCTIGRNALVREKVKIYPGKTVEDGSVVSSSLIWGEKWGRSIFGAFGIYGLANFEISPEFAAKVGASFAASFGREVTISTSRDSHKVSRMINRAIMTGALSVGCNINDYGVTPLPVVRYITRSNKEEFGGIHTRRSPYNPAFVDIKFFDENGLDQKTAVERNIERLFFREDFPRADMENTGEISFPGGSIDFYISGFLRSIDQDAIQGGNFTIVIDYSYGASSLIFPRILGKMGVETVVLNAILDSEKLTRSKGEFDRALQNLGRIVRSLDADLGFLLDAGGEKIFICDEKGEIVDDMTALLVYAYLSASQNPGTSIAVPVTASRNVEIVANRFKVDVKRGGAMPRSLMELARQEKYALVADNEGGLIFPSFHPAFDGMFSMAKLLEFLAKEKVTLSEVEKELPATHLRGRNVPVSWEKKGWVMRKLVELSEGKDAELIDGVKVYKDDGDWVLIIPSQDEAYFRIYAESESEKKVSTLLSEYSRIIEQWKET